MNAVQPAYQPEENRREYGAAGRRDVGVRYERVGVQDGAAVDGRDDGDIRALSDFVATKEDVDGLWTEVTEGLAAFRAEMLEQFAELRAEQKANKADLERRLDKMEARLDARLDAQGKELAMIRRLLYGFFGAVISLLVAIMAGLVNGWFVMGG